jgi:hypothetical protein
MWIIIIVSSIMLMQILGAAGRKRSSYRTAYKDCFPGFDRSAIIIENEFHGTLAKKVR